MSNVPTPRRLAAILAADVVGYSALMAADEAGTLAALRAHRRDLFDPETARRGGRIVKLMGDGALAEFPSVVDAVECAIAIQTALAVSGGPIRLRIGINLGDVIVEGDDIYGDGVNVAARLEALAEPGGICISSIVHESLGNRVEAAFTDAGEHQVKGLPRPIRVYRWAAAGRPAATLSPAPTAAGGKPAIAILPFDNMSSNPEQGHIADGLCEDLTTALSKIDTFSVISRTAAFAYKGKGVSAIVAARELGAGYVVEGSVRAAGPRIRINAQLIRAADGDHVWAEKYDGTVDDIFDLQDRITQQIVAALEVHLSDGAQVMVWRREAGSPKAYDAFIAARAAYKEYSRSGNARARQLYESAIALSPRFASAHAGLARTYLEDAHWGWSPSRAASVGEAQRNLDLAFAADPGNAPAQAELAHLLMVSFKFDRARTEAEKAVALDPNLADALHVMATILNCLNRPKEALHFAREGIRRNPGMPEFYLMAMAEAHVALGQYDDAQALAQRVLARRPDWLMAHAMSVIAWQGAGNRERAREAAARITQRSARFTVSRWQYMVHYPDRADVPRLKQLLIDAGLPE